MLFQKNALVLGTVAFLLIAPRGFGQTKAVRICVAQVKGTDVPPTPSYDAAKLAEQLSERELSDGQTVAAVVITEKTAKALSARINQEGCGYLVKVWRHGNLNASYSGSPDAANRMPAGGAVAFDRDTVDFELRGVGTRKVVARGAEPVPTIYAKQGHRLFVPYPLLATQIAAKLSRSH